MLSSPDPWRQMAKDIDVGIAGIKGLRSRLRGLGKSKDITAVLQSRLADAWILGAAAFIRTAIQKMKVDTGMSAATFLAVSRAVKRNRVESVVRAKVRTKLRTQYNGVPTFPRGARRTGVQDSDTGDALGERAYILTVPQVGGTQFSFQFSFQTVAWQMAAHRFGQEALEAGIAAMEARVTKEFETRARFVLAGFFLGRSVPRQGIEQGRLL